MGRSRSFYIASAVVGACLALSACGNAADSGDDASSTAPSVEEIFADLADLPYAERMATITKKAEEEGTVVMYASANTEQQDAWAEAFNEAYPKIALQYVRVDSSTLGERMRAEKAAGRSLFDVASTDSVTGALLAADGLYTAHQGVPIPDDYPEQYIDDTFAIQYINPNVIAWNTDLVSESEAPRDYDDLLDPKWKGKVAVDFVPDNWIAGLLESRGEEGASTFLDNFVNKNEALVRKGHTSIAESLAAGEFPIAAEVYSYTIEGLKADGAPVDYASPKPTPANATGVSISETAPHPYAAALMMNFLLTEKGGQVVGDLGRLSVNPAVADIYAGHKRYTTAGTPEYENLLPILPALADKWATKASDLVEQYLGADRVAR